SIQAHAEINIHARKLFLEFVNVTSIGDNGKPAAGVEHLFHLMENFPEIGMNGAFSTSNGENPCVSNQFQKTLKMFDVKNAFGAVAANTKIATSVAEIGHRIGLVPRVGG